jgi:hypothetical protein
MFLNNNHKINNNLLVVATKEQLQQKLANLFKLANSKEQSLF